MRKIIDVELLAKTLYEKFRTLMDDGQATAETMSMLRELFGFNSTKVLKIMNEVLKGDSK